jgi:hypothetical protein
MAKKIVFLTLTPGFRDGDHCDDVIVLLLFLVGENIHVLEEECLLYYSRLFSEAEFASDHLNEFRHSAPGVILDNQNVYSYVSVSTHLKTNVN